MKSLVIVTVLTLTTSLMAMEYIVELTPMVKNSGKISVSYQITDNQFEIILKSRSDYLDTHPLYKKVVDQIINFYGAKQYSTKFVDTKIRHLIVWDIYNNGKTQFVIPKNKLTLDELRNFLFDLESSEVGLELYFVVWDKIGE